MPGTAKHLSEGSLEGMWSKNASCQHRQVFINSRGLFLQRFHINMDMSVGDLIFDFLLQVPCDFVGLADRHTGLYLGMKIHKSVRSGFPGPQVAELEIAGHVILKNVDNRFFFLIGQTAVKKRADGMGTQFPCFPNDQESNSNSDNGVQNFDSG